MSYFARLRQRLHVEFSDDVVVTMKHITKVINIPLYYVNSLHLVDGNFFICTLFSMLCSDSDKDVF